MENNGRIILNIANDDHLREQVRAMVASEVRRIVDKNLIEGVIKDAIRNIAHHKLSRIDTQTTFERLLRSEIQNQLMIGGVQENIVLLAARQEIKDQVRAALKGVQLRDLI